jgi:hypothetical protein
MDQVGGGVRSIDLIVISIFMRSPLCGFHPANADTLPGFYINLPIGGATIIFLVLFLQTPNPTRTRTSELTIREQILRLDPLGSFFFLPGVVTLLLALQWGGTAYSWSNGRIIALLVLGSILLLAFLLVQIYGGENTTVPLRIMRQRSVYAGFIWSLCIGGALITMVYYLPLWFQVIKNVSAVQSGIRLIPYVLALVVGSMLAGAITFKTGYYTPSMLFSSVVAAVGAGLITTWRIDTSSAKWIGYQVIFGLGLGAGMQQGNMGVQTVLVKRDVPIGTALLFFGQTLGGAIFLSVAQSVFNNTLRHGLQQIDAMDSTRAALVVNAGALEFRKFVAPEMLEDVLKAFNKALMRGMDAAVATASCLIVGAVTMEWRSIKNGEGQGEKKQEKESKDEEVARGTDEGEEEV